MPTLEDLREIKEVYVHASCADGLASAMICARAFKILGMDPNIEFMQYHSSQHLELEPKVGQMFVDITPPLGRWEEWKEFKPIILDHHITAKPVTEELNGVYGESDDSGATLALKHVLGLVTDVTKTEWEKFANSIMIRDTWKSSHPAWEDAQIITNGIMLLDSENLIQNSKKDEINFEELYKIGKIFYDKTMTKSKIVATNSYKETWLKRGVKYNIGFYNTTERNTSEIAHILIDEQECDLTIGYFLYYENNEASLVVSLRSNGIVDVSKLAEKFDGGGHIKAAGFTLKNTHNISAQNLLSKIRNMFLDL